jgi:Tol biopolymer transport system component/predicted Ser/Thr protein kinase
MKPGDRLGPYEIVAPIGAGGMGEVYKARDTRLDRTVAIKVSREQFSQRFEREARSVAALNHPNICTLFDVGPNYLVMELIEGPTLDERIKQGAIPLEESLNIARQIADALEAAHEKGIVHRDLKPANVKIKPDGVVKVLDFGLAKVGGTPTAPPTSDSPTLTMGVSEAGMILGTAAYMSPEQARGRLVDKRADIWAFGVVLYEMITGRHMFEGDDVSEILAAVIKDEPNWEAIPASAKRLLRSCLQKDPKKRLRDIADVWLLLDEAPGAAAQQRRSVLPWAAAAVLAVTTVALGSLYFHRPVETPRVTKTFVLPPENGMFYRGSTLPALSPDGRRLAFVATVENKTQIWVRNLDSLAFRTLPGTDDARHPFWSPDGRFIAFFAGGKLKKTDSSGGPVLSLCDAPDGRGGSWNKKGVIIFAPHLIRTGLFRVPAAGGSPTPLTVPDEGADRFPWFLPDGRHFVYNYRSSIDPKKSGIYVGDIDSLDDPKARRKLLTVDSNAAYAPPGYLLFVRERTLMAQPFDAATAQTTGDPAPVAENVDYATVDRRGQFSVSENVLAYHSGGSEQTRQLTWVDRSGKVTGTLGSPGIINYAAISPDGANVVVERGDPETALVNLWLYDLARGTASRFTSDFGRFPVWSPAGSHIAFLSSDGKINQKSTSGVAQEEILGKEAHSGRPMDWSRDGRYLIEGTFDSLSEIWVLPLFGDRKRFVYVKGNFATRFAKLSPNGKWLAYASDETKQGQVYVQNFPTPGRKWQVSTNGGNHPVWSRDGRELFYIGPDRKLMAVDVNAEGQLGSPRPLFTVLAAGGSQFDVSKDGRFLIRMESEQSARAPMTVVVNWAAGLK